MKYLYGTLAVLLAVLALIALIWLCKAQNDAVRASVEKYEVCIEKQYGRAPSAIYQATGEMPVCNR